jgi:hypothetical protein
MGKKKKHEDCAAVDIGQVLADMESPDDEVRGKAVRELCPCHAGWEAFEQHVAAVSRLTRDGSRAVRAHALHVFQDAAEMHSLGDPAHRIQFMEEMTRKKRASPRRPEEVEREARQKGRVKKWKRGRVGI